MERYGPVLSSKKNMKPNGLYNSIIYLNFEINRRNLSIGAMFTYEGLPEGLKTELQVRVKTEEDPEVLRERQELVKTKKPSELAQV